jgi:lysophospholipase L1-like esterase
MSAAPGNALGRLVAPWALFAGLAAGFTACCLAGRAVSRQNPFERFERFHPLLAPETLFYPTACQVRALAQSRLDPHKIAVVVGGDSVLQGAGQTVRQMWTRKLQRLLGDQYQVLNLGFRGAYPAEFGATAAEILAKDYPKLIFISDVHRGAMQPDPDGVVHKYFFWDAYSKGLLPHDPERDARLRQVLGDAKRLERAGQMRQQKQQTGQLTAEEQRAIRTQMRLDSALYFRDLWNTIGHQHLFTVWTPQARACFCRPRKDFPDNEPEAPPLSRRYTEDVRKLLAELRACMQITCVPDGDRGWAENLATTAWQTFDHSARTAFPAAARRRTLLLVMSYSPYYIDRLSPREQACYAQVRRITRRHLEKLGFAVLEVGKGFEPADYLDVIHLAEPGGAKLAAAVAPAVRALARRLGYEQGGGQVRP